MSPIRTPGSKTVFVVMVPSDCTAEGHHSRLCLSKFSLITYEVSPVREEEQVPEALGQTYLNIGTEKRKKLWI